MLYFRFATKPFVKKYIKQHIHSNKKAYEYSVSDKGFSRKDYVIAHIENQVIREKNG